MCSICVLDPMCSAYDPVCCNCVLSPVCRVCDPVCSVVCWIPLAASMIKCVISVCWIPCAVSMISCAMSVCWIPLAASMCVCDPVCSVLSAAPILAHPLYIHRWGKDGWTPLSVPRLLSGRVTECPALVSPCLLMQPILRWGPALLGSLCTPSALQPPEQAHGSSAAEFIGHKSCCQHSGLD